VAGCGSLPEGKPPEGEITERYKEPGVYSPDKAVNKMVTSITTRCEPVFMAGGHRLKIKKVFHADRARYNVMPEKVVRSLMRMKIVQPVNFFFKADFDYVLKSSCVRTKNINDPGLEWTMELVGPDMKKSYWREKVKLKIF
jgi:hypothetical protein